MASKVSGVIENINVSGTSHAIASTAYGYCTTDASEPNKTVEMTGFYLSEGVTVHIKFEHENTTLAPTLNIDNTGAKTILFPQVPPDINGNIYGWNANAIVTFTYDGSNWIGTNSAYAVTAGHVISGNIYPSQTKTYPAYTCSADNADKAVLLFGKININDYTIWQTPWSIHYRLYVSTTESATQGWYDVTLSVNGSTVTYYNKNNFYSTSYRPIYHHCLIYPKSGYSSYGGYFGVRVQSARTVTTLARIFKIEILETKNCTIEMLESLKRRDEIYIATDGHAADTLWYYGEYDGASYGLREYGDDNSYDLLQMSNNYITNGSTLRFPPYTLFGYDRVGHVQAFSLYSTDYTSSTTSINTARIYNTIGFDWQRGIYYSSSGTNYAISADINIGVRIAHSGADFRYTDNTVAASTANNLGLVARTPVYFRGTIENDGLFYLAPLEVQYSNKTYKRIWTQDIPTEADGFVYWFIGYPYYNSSYPNSLYQIDLYAENKLYWYHNGRFEEYIEHANSASHADTATKFNSDRTIELTGAVTGSTTADGSSGWTIATTVNHGHGNITSDGKRANHQTTGDANTYRFLREDGTWVVPAYTTNTNNAVTQTANTENKEFSILLKNSNNTTSPETAGVKFANTTNKLVTVNPSTGNISAATFNKLILKEETTGFSIEGGTASKKLIVNNNYTLAAACAKSVDTETMTSSSTNLPTAKAVAAYITSQGFLTSQTQNTAVLYATSENGTGHSASLNDPYLRLIDGTSGSNVQLEGSGMTTVRAVNGKITINTPQVTASTLGLEAALRFKGTTNTNITLAANKNNSTITIDGASYTAIVGDVVLYDDGEYGDGEYLWTDDGWEELGHASAFKKIQTAITNDEGDAAVNAQQQELEGEKFIYSFSQDAEGVVSVLTRKVPTYTHPTGNGNQHLPEATGDETGYYLRCANASTGAGEWHALTLEDLGATSVTLNDVDCSGDTATFYAPLSYGAAGSPLIGAGENKEPIWYDGLTLSGASASDYSATFAGTTNSTSKDTGSVLISGGLGVSYNVSAAKYIVDDHVTLQWNSTDQSLDFIFA